MIGPLTKTQALIAGGVVAVVVIGGATAFALTGNDKKATAQRDADQLVLGQRRPRRRPRPGPRRRPSRSRPRSTR